MDYLQYLNVDGNTVKSGTKVLNLVINGLPSILTRPNTFWWYGARCRFKPCYKWITFNTVALCFKLDKRPEVLNLVINGLPSILKRILKPFKRYSIKVLNLVINGLPSIR